MFRQAEAELVKQGFLLRRGLGDPAESDLTPIRRGKDYIRALRRGQQSQRLHRGHRLRIFHSAGRWLGEGRGPALQQMFERHPESIAEERHHHVGLDARRP